MIIPGTSSIIPRQFALPISALVRLYLKANPLSVSPVRTVYGNQPGGGGQVVSEGVSAGVRLGIWLAVRLGRSGVEVWVISNGVAVLIKGIDEGFIAGRVGNKVWVGNKVEVGTGWFPSDTVRKRAPSINTKETRAVTIPQMTWRVFCILAL
jgi:hypothetical protein